jgi:hypothetical protein
MSPPGAAIRAARVSLSGLPDQCGLAEPGGRSARSAAPGNATRSLSQHHQQRDAAERLCRFVSVSPTRVAPRHSGISWTTLSR